MNIPRLVAIAVVIIYTEWIRKASTEPSVKFVAMVYRHGARTPVNPYPTDPYKNESLWPEKFGQLTNAGKLEHYILGTRLRKRYQKLLSARFDPDEIYIKSTNVDRTIMSAEINTAGLYPPKGNEIWNKKLKWQPVPIHTVPEDDPVLAMNGTCPAYVEEMMTYVYSPEYLTYLKSQAGLMQYVSSYVGINITTFTHLEYIYSVLNIEQENNFVLPNWTTSVFPERMMEPACFSFKVPTATHKLARLKAGLLLKEITTHMKRTVLGEKTKKVLVYSGHDNTVANLLGALRLFRVHCPPYTATVFIELAADATPMRASAASVRVLYRNTTGYDEPHVLRIPGCGDVDWCPYRDFIDLYENITDVDFDRECRVMHIDDNLIYLSLMDNLFKVFWLFVCVLIFYMLLANCQHPDGRCHHYDAHNE